MDNVKSIFLYWRNDLSFLIFCSYEVGGLPYAYAQALNHQGQKTYYVSLAKPTSGHDSSSFHFGFNFVPWDLSSNFRTQDGVGTIASKLRGICKKYAVAQVFATGDKAYLLDRANIPYSYWSYGSDLDQICLPRFPSWSGTFSQWKFFLYCLLHKGSARRSICQSKQVMIAPYQLNALDKVCKHKKKFFLPHLIQAEAYETVLMAKKLARQELQVRHHAENIFFSVVRHYWKGARSAWSDNKGNDKIVRAFALYLEKTNFKNDKLLLIEKGPDVIESKKLAQSLGIDRWLVWLPEMKRSDLQIYLSGATACLGQFGTPVLTYAQLEPLAWATPCISYYGEVNNRVPFYDSRPPIVQAKTAEEILAAMLFISTNHDKAEQFSNMSWKWINENCSEKFFVEQFSKAMRTLQ